jgi:hypothetical protein
VSPTHQLHVPCQGRSLALFSVRIWVDPRTIVWLEGLGQQKIPMAPSGVEPTTFQLVAQCLNQLCYCVPLYHNYTTWKMFTKTRNLWWRLKEVATFLFWRWYLEVHNGLPSHKVYCLPSLPTSMCTQITPTRKLFIPPWYTGPELCMSSSCLISIFPSFHQQVLSRHNMTCVGLPPGQIFCYLCSKKYDLGQKTQV